MAQSAANRKYDALHESRPFHDGAFGEWSEKRSDKTPYHYRDGVTVWVSDLDLTPHDHFLGGGVDCAECSPTV